MSALKQKVDQLIEKEVLKHLIFIINSSSINHIITK